MPAVAYMRMSAKMANMTTSSMAVCSCENWGGAPCQDSDRYHQSKRRSQSH